MIFHFNQPLTLDTTGDTTMAIMHTIRNDKGKLVEINLSPIKAIRLFCIECMGYQIAEIPRCTAPNCPLFPFKMGDAHKEMSEDQRKQLSDAMLERYKNKSTPANHAQESTISPEPIVG
jgi:hypothetical protein